MAEAQGPDRLHLDRSDVLVGLVGTERRADDGAGGAAALGLEHRVGDLADVAVGLRDFGSQAFRDCEPGVSAVRPVRCGPTPTRQRLVTASGCIPDASLPVPAATTMSVEPPRKRAAIADPEAREFLRNADPVLARLIDARPDFRPRAWLDELPPLDVFGSLIFQVAGQQLSVASTRAIISHLEERFGGHLPSPAELLAADPQVLRESG